MNFLQGALDQGFLSLGVMGLLIATSAYGTSDCPSIQSNVSNILSIGPWNGHLTVITTDLQLFEGNLGSPGPGPDQDQSTFHFQLASPVSLATTEPVLYGILKGPRTLPSAETLIEVHSPAAMERLVLLANESAHSWVINPLNGVTHLLDRVHFLLDATWLSSDSLQFYALNGQGIQGATYGLEERRVYEDATVRYWETGDGDTLKVVDQPTRDAPHWKVKKAFHWQGNFYLLTSETVYVFEDSVLTRKVALFKVPYRQFFICPEPKEAPKNGSDKETKEEETSKGTVTRAHWAHPSSTVAQHVNVVAWVLGLLCLFCLFAGFVGALLYYFLVYSKKESLQGRVLSSGSVSFNGGLVHIHSKTGEPKVGMASSKGPPTSVSSQLPGGLRVPTKVNVDVAKKQAARLALKRASTGALKVKREKSKVQGASANKTK